MIRSFTSRTAPADLDARAVFDALETARVEALGARAMGGVRENLAHLTEARVRGDAIVRARNAEEVPLATAVGLIARERLTGEAPPKAALAGLKLVAPWIEDKAAAELDALGADARRPGGLRQAVAAAARGPRPRRRRGAARGRTPRRAATTRRATKAAARIRAEQGRRRRAPPAATSRCAARRPRTARPRASEAEEMELGEDEGAAPATSSAKASSPRPAGATGTCRRKPTTRPSPPASTRSSRPSELCDEEELGRLRAYLDQQMGGLAECRHPARQPAAAAAAGAAGAQLGFRPGGGHARRRAARAGGRQSRRMPCPTRSSATPSFATPSSRC